LFLADCVIGAVDGSKFTIKGKDISGSKIGQKMAMNSDFQFKAHTPSDAQQWHSIIASFANHSASLPTSPAESRNITPIATKMEEPQQQGVVATSPHSAQPQSATAMSPMSAGSTYHGAPAHSPLEDRKYVEKQ
jgi:hypothetical protein